MGRWNFLENTAPLDTKEGKLSLAAVMMMIYLLAMFLAIAIHEILGHGLATVLLGGEFYAFYLSPGSGFISFYLPDTISTSQVAFIYMAGILVQFAIGLAVFFLVLPKVKSFLWGIFTLMFSVGMLVHPALYLFLGYFYGSGDTRYAVSLLGVQPDAFIVTGLILTGIFVLMVSMAAMNFIGKHVNVEDEAMRKQILMIFWMPPIILSGVSAIASAFFLPADEVSYTIANATIMLLFMGIAIYLIPVFVEPERKAEYRVSAKSILSVLIVFVMLLSVWVGVFGVSQSSAHGVLLYDPPVEVEQYYADYSIGNAEIMIFTNGTARVDIILRNQLRDPSPMEERIFHTFDERPYWEKYIQKSRNMVITMFDLQKEVGENISFNTGFGTVRALGVEDDLGRRCTTYLQLWDNGTRQGIAPPGGDFIPPWDWEGDIIINFVDPWYNRGGYLDEVRISWDPDLDLYSVRAYNDYQESIDYNRGSIYNCSIGWKNINLENSPSNYKVELD